MERANLSLKWLEVFQAVSREGSVQAAARHLALSISTASHHLACLEDAVGIELIDHKRRPLRLTSAGEILLRRVDESLSLLRKGVAEVWSNDPGSMVRRLKLASIEDLDMEVTPFLASSLGLALPACELGFLSRPSHEIISLLQSEEVDLGIASAAEFRSTQLAEAPLMRDPYILIVPLGQDRPADDFLNDDTGLSFLRYSKKQMLGQRIEVQLRRLRKHIPNQLEFESTQAILSLIAEGQAWTITTALNFACAHRYHDRVQPMALSDGGFTRRLSLFWREDLPETIVDLVDQMVRELVQGRVIAPTLTQVPWLKGEFRLLERTE